MKLEKIEIKEQSRKLAAKWTVETHTITEPNYAEEALDDITREIQEEIDWEIMCEMLVKLGYTKIKMKWPERINEVRAHEIKEWNRANLKGHYQGRGNIWLFDSEKDANLFILKWA